jgi:hypothetical protein
MATGALDRPSVAASWLKFTGAHRRSDYQDFAEWVIRQMFNTPLDPGGSRTGSVAGSRPTRRRWSRASSRTSPRQPLKPNSRWPRIRRQSHSSRSRQRGHGIRRCQGRCTSNGRAAADDHRWRPQPAGSHAHCGEHRLHQFTEHSSTLSRAIRASFAPPPRPAEIVVDNTFYLAGGHPCQSSRIAARQTGTSRTC